MKKIISNLLICFLLLGFALNIDVNIVKAVNIDTADVLLSGTTSTNQLYIDDNLELTFNITPTGEIRVERTPVSIVLVMDTSGSMKENNKMENAKIAAKNLIDRMYNTRVSGDKVGIVDFETIVNDDDNTSWYLWGSLVNRKYRNSTPPLLIENNKELLKSKIDVMYADGGTNLQAGLLKAQAYLNGDTNEKHVIVVTDGNPTFYNSYENGYNVIRGNGKTYDSGAVNRAVKAAEALNNMGVKVHFLGISIKDGDINPNFFNNDMKDVSGIKYMTNNSNDIDPLLNNIYKEIVNESKLYKNIQFEYPIPQGFEVTSLPNGFRVENGKIIGNLNEIKFENMKGTPNTVQSFKIGIKNTRKVGEVNLGNAKINYVVEDNNGASNASKQFNLGNVNYNIRDLYNYINFSNLTPTKNLVSNKTVVGIKTNLTKNRLYDFDPNAIVEVEVEFKDKNSNSFLENVLKIDFAPANQNKIVFNNSNKGLMNQLKAKFEIRDKSLEKEVNIVVKKINIRFLGRDYIITDPNEIKLYFGNNLINNKFKVKKFIYR